MELSILFVRGDFMQGFVMGAVTGAIGAGVYTFVSSAWGSTLTTSIVSGAIAGGITGELFGEGFEKGAVFGAVTGAISFGVDTRFGEYASRGTFNRLIIDGLKGGFGALARGGDFVSGFGYGMVYSVDKKKGKKIENNANIKELKDLGIEVKRDLVRVEKTQTMEEGVVTTKFEIYVKKDMSSLSVEPDNKNIFGTQASHETNSSIIMMSVSVKSTGTLTVDANLGFENKHLTIPYGWLNGQPEGSYSIGEPPSPSYTKGDVRLIWRKYQWDAIVIKGKANIAVGIVYHPINEYPGNLAVASEVYVKMDLSQFIK